MTDYFYTDPLAAAWMAKHFGMRFDYSSINAWKDGTQGVGIAETWMEDDGTIKTEFEYTMPILIHPDSLPLLEPAVLDLCLIQEDGEPEDYRCLWDLDLVVRGIHRVKRIIERKGVAFMWPESAN